MVPIHTHPPSKEYDEGWDRIFGPKRDTIAPKQPVSVPETPQNEVSAPERDEPLTGHELAEKYGFEPTPERRAALRELARMSEEFGGYLPEQNPPNSRPEDVPADPESKRHAPNP